ncbi:MAG TPA: hypothetical protein PKD79_02350 [Candidatus Doudnabacteria bacterium]|nr:hypothetical protein [Candidatus Doudnabacteria bacterium]
MNNLNREIPGQARDDKQGESQHVAGRNDVEGSNMAHHDHHEGEGAPIEYVKFAGVIAGIIAISLLLHSYFGETFRDWMRYFMGTFFVVFAGFKFLDLPGFVMSYIGYDIIAKRSMLYAKTYPFIELGLGIAYLLSQDWADYITLPLMTIGAIGVAQQLLRGSKIRCACLGTYIKLPLTTVSLAEDLLMGAMAAYMIFM